MRHSVRLCFLFLFGAFLSAAQSQAQAASPSSQRSYGVAGAAGIDLPAGQRQVQATHALDPRSDGCPINFRAQHGWDGSMVAVRGPQPGGAESRPKGTGQALHLIVTNPRSGRIVGAGVTLRGFSEKGRAMQTSQEDAFDVVRTQVVNFPAGTGKEITADLWVPGMTSVQVVQLDSVTYADGSIWKLEAPKACRATPEMLMRVAGR